MPLIQVTPPIVAGISNLPVGTSRSYKPRSGGGDVFFVESALAAELGKLAALRHPRFDLISLSGHRIHEPKGVGADRSAAATARDRRWNHRCTAADRNVAGGRAPPGPSDCRTWEGRTARAPAAVVESPHADA